MGPLGGMKLALGFVALLFVAFLVWTIAASDGPGGAELQVDGRIGEVTGSG